MLTFTTLKLALVALAVAGGGAATAVTLSTAGPLAHRGRSGQVAATATTTVPATVSPTAATTPTRYAPSPADPNPPTGTPALTPYVVTPPPGTPTPRPFTPAPTPTPRPGTQAQVPPLPAAPPIPADWKTFTQPATSETGAFSFRYPPAWIVGPQPPPPAGFPPRGYTLVLTSWDPTGKSGGPPPMDGMKLDLYVDRLSYRTTCSAPKPSPAHLGNLPGRVGLYIAPVPTALEFVQVYDFEAAHGDFSYCLSVGFSKTSTGSSPRIELLSQILSSLVIQ